MTILQPNRAKTKLHLKLIAGVSFLVLVAVSTFGVFTYTQTVDLRHRISKLEGTFSELQAENADLKNYVYSLLSPEHLVEVGQGFGLRLEKRPNYLEAPIEVLATQL